MSILFNVRSYLDHKHYYCLSLQKENNSTLFVALTGVLIKFYGKQKVIVTRKESVSEVHIFFVLSSISDFVHLLFTRA